MTPGGNFVLRAGDRIFVTAPTRNLALLLKNLGVSARRVRHCLLGGGGRVSFYLAQLLEKDGMRVRILEKDALRCRELAELLPNAEVIQGDFSSRKELEQAGLGDCDAFLSMTGIDEMNMVTSLYAASQGVRKVVTKLSRPENSLLAGDLSLGSIVCPRELCSNDIVRYVRAMENQTGAAVSVHGIADGKAEAVEFLADGNTRNLGVALKELKLRPNVLVASICHGSRVEIPHGGSTVLEGDSVVVVTTERGTIDTLNDIFAD
jgi:trk system potassium uptake protein TrkA